MVHIYPSLLAAQENQIKSIIQHLSPYCAGLHLDVMDNIFVPNTGISLALVNEISSLVKSVWIHLMVENPLCFYQKLILPDHSLVSFHIESKADVKSLIKIIKEKKHRASIAINPKTPLSEVFPFCDIVDQVLVMSVNPGFSYQHFLESSLDRIIELINFKKKHNLFFSIGVDGGVNADNLTQVIYNGAEDLVIGGGIFGSENPLLALWHLQKIASGNYFKGASSQ